MSLSLSEWMGVVHTPEMEWPRGNVRQFQLKTPEKLCFSSDRNLNCQFCRSSCHFQLEVG